MRRKRRKYKKFPIIILLIANILLTYLLLLIVFDNKPSQNPPKVYDNLTTQPAIDIHSEAMMLISLDTLETIATKNEDLIMYPASLTKIMTTLVLIEQLESFNQYFMMTYDILEQNQIETASIAGIILGDELRAIDLLYGTMLPSGADATLMLVFGLGYTESEFAQLMNAKANELGMHNTHFTNPTGIHHNSQYTTASDMTKLLTYALKNETFRQIYTTFNYTTRPTPLNGYGYEFISTATAKIENMSFAWGEIIGAKTGYTGEAGLNLSSLATDNNNEEYILVTLGAPGSATSEPYHFYDAFNIYNQFLNK